MNDFKEITKNISSDLEYFEDLLHQITDSREFVISDILDYIFESKGKRIRPVLVYLTARLFNEPTLSTHHAALLVEIVHTATLLHDDVVDVAALRRGRLTVNNKWDDKTAILSGDFLFAKAMKIATDNQEYKLFDIITPAIMNLTIGELMQMKNANDFSVEECKYYDVIKNKTASLISISCESGSYTAGANKNDIINCRNFGEKLGCIFQIKDDILDYIGDTNTGKQKGIDIKEKKVTLPLICAWKNMDDNQHNILIDLWNSVDENPGNAEHIIRMVIENEGITGSENEMKRLKEEAMSILCNFNDSEAKFALAELVDYVIDRDK